MLVSLSCGFVQNQRCRHPGVERFNLLRVWDHYTFIGLGESIAGDACAFVTDQQRHSSFKVGLGKRVSLWGEGPITSRLQLPNPGKASPNVSGTQAGRQGGPAAAPF